MAISDETLLEIYTKPHALYVYIKAEVHGGKCRYKIGIHLGKKYRWRRLVESERPLSILSREVAISNIRAILEMAVKKSKSETEGENGADVLTQSRIDKIIELFKENNHVDTSVDGLLLSA